MSKTPYAIAIVPLLVLVSLPFAGVADFYLSYLYIVFFWIVLSTSWGILSGYTGYWSFGHAAFFGAGVYTTATLAGAFKFPFLLTVLLGGAVAAAISLLIGAVVFRSKSLRGEFFALLTLSVTFVLAAIISNSPIDSGTGVLLSAVAIPMIARTSSGSLYLLGLAAAVMTVGLSYTIFHSRFGGGLLAIHDDEDVAEVKGVPTFRYKLTAFALSSAVAGMMGSIHAVYVGYVTVGETFAVTMPLYVVLMSILGGARHWAGPAVGATIIAVMQSAIVGGSHAELGRACVALALIVVILTMPLGIVPGVIRRLHERRLRPGKTDHGADFHLEIFVPGVGAHKPRRETDAAALLTCVDVAKSFGGIRALNGVTLNVSDGEILALVGPNGSGKSTLINMISGHHALTSGKITMQNRDVSGLPPHKITRYGIARTYQIPRLFKHLSVRDNVRLCAEFGGATGLGGADGEAIASQWLAFTGLADKADLLPESLNLHDRKFVEFARALAARPRLLLLDEVLCGLNPSEVDHAVEMIRKIRDSGVTIVFVEHLMRAVVALADRVAVLDQGKLLAVGNPSETMRNPEVVSVYLGGGHAA
jgi:branched-chain amino acid transport system permease protein